MQLTLTLLTLTLTLTSTLATPTLHSWTTLNYTHPIPDSLPYTPTSCIPSNVRMSHPPEAKLFLSLPRLLPGVPATLATVTPSGVLAPFPSWDAHTPSSPTAIHSAAGLEVDATNTLWVADQGVGLGSKLHPAKLLAYDAATGEEVWRMLFPPSLVSPGIHALPAMVVDRLHEVVFLADYGSSLGGAIVVVDVLSQSAIRVLTASTATSPVPSLWIHINGDPVEADAPLQIGARGIALSPDANSLIVSPLTSHALYSLPTAPLRSAVASNTTATHLNVTLVEEKSYASAGLAYANTSVLYQTSLEDSGIMRGMGKESQRVAGNSHSMLWPASIGWDHKGSLLFTTTSLYLGLEGRLSSNTSNFHIYAVDVGADSYLAHLLPPPGGKGSTNHVEGKLSTTQLFLIIGALLIGSALLFAIMFAVGNAVLRHRHASAHASAQRERIHSAVINPPTSPAITPTPSDPLLSRP